MITKKIQDAINSQINAELWSAYLYLSMSSYAESIGLKGVANWFYVQWLEEQDHARILEEYLYSQDARMLLKPIEAVPVEWKGAVEMFKDALDHEKKVTAMIHNLALLSRQEGDFATFNRIQWFVDEQVEEEENVRDILADLELTGDSDYGMYAFDKELCKREYSVASPLKG
ncbi:MAG: ferritin [Bacteroidales bacterium]|nr:ferritin [Candidatus Cacconaster merdequi]